MRNCVLGTIDWFFFIPVLSSCIPDFHSPVVQPGPFDYERKHMFPVSLELLSLRRSLYAVGLLLLLSSSLGVSAQVLYGSIQGNVTDPSDAAVSSATVKVVNDGTGQTRETKASTSGSYSLPDLLAGTYTLTVSTEGFKLTSGTPSVLRPTIWCVSMCL
jgi:hypothetical protein